MKVANVLANKGSYLVLIIRKIYLKCRHRKNDGNQKFKNTKFSNWCVTAIQIQGFNYVLHSLNGIIGNKHLLYNARAKTCP